MTAQKNKLVKSNSFNQRPVRKEKLPDWVDNPPEENADPDRMAAIEARRQKFLQKKEEENE